MALKRRPAWEGARSRGFKKEPPTESPWKEYTTVKATRLTKNPARPVPSAMAIMRRKRAEPPRETEVKVHLVAVTLISEKDWHIGNYQQLASTQVISLHDLLYALLK